MSQTLLPTFSPANPHDLDTYGDDCTTEMQARGTTIVSIGAVTIDCNPNAATPIVISSVTVLNAGLKYGFKGAGGVAGARYTLTFPLTLADGNVIYRSVVIPVSRYVG